MRLSQMLDLPVEERRLYLHALPLTRVYVADCLETSAIKHIRRLITRHGGVYRECYRYPGVFWVMTFRKHGQMLACIRAIAAWEYQMILAAAFVKVSTSRRKRDYYIGKAAAFSDVVEMLRATELKP